MIDSSNFYTANPFPVINENRVFPVKFSHRDIPVMKTGFSLCGKLHRENPVLALYWPCTGLYGSPEGRSPEGDTQSPSSQYNKYATKSLQLQVSTATQNPALGDCSVPITDINICSPVYI